MFLYMQVTHLQFYPWYLSPIINMDTHTKMQMLTNQNKSKLNPLCNIKIKNSTKNLGKVSGRKHKRV